MTESITYSLPLLLLQNVHRNVALFEVKINDTKSQRYQVFIISCSLSKVQTLLLPNCHSPCPVTSAVVVRGLRVSWPGWGIQTLVEGE